ncbi:hypothetical protein TNCV_3001791 [Trichonephila clavipes]|nr:hypothetical protein TNCV_3001791 [Trichonephila clavipes]
MWFQHDEAPAHFNADVRSALDTVNPGRWIGWGGPVNWPEVVVAAWSTTPSSTTRISGINEFCSDGRELRISPPEHKFVCATYPPLTIQILSSKLKFVAGSRIFSLPCPLGSLGPELMATIFQSDPRSEV